MKLRVERIVDQVRREKQAGDEEKKNQDIDLAYLPRPKSLEITAMLFANHTQTEDDKNVLLPSKRQALIDIIKRAEIVHHNQSVVDSRVRSAHYLNVKKNRELLE